jgi:sec-independent protein translocase protein TatA
MPFGIQPIHLIIVAVVALIIFGPTRLPEIGRGLGKAINEFRKGTKEMTEGFREEVTTHPEQPQVPVQTVSPPTPAGNLESGNFCVHCGAPNPEGATFCNKCGTQLPSAKIST